MDGIVPVLYAVITLICIVGTGICAALCGLIMFRPKRVGTKSLAVAKINLVILCIGTLVTISAKNTIVGYTPLIYVAPVLFVASIVILFICKRINVTG